MILGLSNFQTGAWFPFDVFQFSSGNTCSRSKSAAHVEHCQKRDKCLYMNRENEQREKYLLRSHSRQPSAKDEKPSIKSEIAKVPSTTSNEYPRDLPLTTHARYSKVSNKRTVSALSHVILFDCNNKDVMSYDHMLVIFCNVIKRVYTYRSRPLKMEENDNVFI